MSKEHIVPFGLNGPWVLSDASCQACAASTSRDEMLVLRGPFHKARIAAKLPSRRKNEQPQYLPVSIQREGQNQEVNVRREDYPAVVAMLHFEPPSYLGGGGGKGFNANGSTLFSMGGLTIPELGRQLAADGITMEFSYEPIGAFARMLAKIAYGFAVVAAGCDLTQFEDVYVLPAMIAGGNDIGRWVGGSRRSEPPVTNYLHYITLSLSDGEIIVYVRLFARYNAPEYCVVVGRLREKKSLANISLPQGAHWTY